MAPAWRAEHRLPPPVQPEPLARVRAHEGVERARGAPGRLDDPGARRARAGGSSDVEHVEDVAARRGPAARRRRRAARARDAASAAGRAVGERAVCPRKSTGDGVALGERAPGRSSSRRRRRGASTARARADGARARRRRLHAERAPASTARTRSSQRDARCFVDDEQLDVARDRARRQVPVAGVRRRDDDAPPARERALASAPRDAASMRDALAAPARRARASQRNSTADAPSDAVHRRGACAAGSRDPGRAHRPPRRARAGCEGRCPRATRAARRARERTRRAARTRHRAQPNPARRTTLPADGLAFERDGEHVGPDHERRARASGCGRRRARRPA